MFEEPEEHIPERTFILKYTFDGLSKLEDNGRLFSVVEEHYGVQWRTIIRRQNQHFGFFLNCNRDQNTDPWSINVDYSLRIVPSSGEYLTESDSSTFNNEIKGTEPYDKLRICPTRVPRRESCLTTFNGCGWDNFVKWENFLKLLTPNDKLDIVARVRVRKMRGVYKPDMRCFDESMSIFSNVVLKVQNVKFYVCGLYLSVHSLYIKSLILHRINESKSPEFDLTGIDSDDFQNYLEVLYGEPAINDITVQGILFVARALQTPIVTEKCQKFLMTESQHSFWKKARLSIEYYLVPLREQCIEENVEEYDKLFFNWY